MGNTKSHPITHSGCKATIQPTTVQINADNENLQPFCWDAKDDHQDLCAPPSENQETVYSWPESNLNLAVQPDA